MNLLRLPTSLLGYLLNFVDIETTCYLPRLNKAWNDIFDNNEINIEDYKTHLIVEIDVPIPRTNNFKLDIKRLVDIVHQYNNLQYLSIHIILLINSYSNQE